MPIPTTHTGSLPRPAGLIDSLRSPDAARDGTLQARIRQAVAEAVRKQRDIGLDIINDGEQGRRHYATYIQDRLSGFDGPTEPYDLPRDQRAFPEYEAFLRARGVNRPGGPTCNGPVAWKDFAAVKRDIDNLRAALPAGCMAFMSSVSPGQAARIMKNRFYPSEDAYLDALADALREEYRAIVEAGFILQVDCPDLASGWNNLPDSVSVEEFRRIAARNVEALDRALHGLPPERLRMHLCWGNYEGPHVHDIPLESIIDIVYGARPAGLSVEGANPRHGHEWRVFERHPLPAGKVLIPGVIDSCTNYVDHPELVAERLQRHASVVGAERLIAGTDCGFASTGSSPVLPAIAWAKLAALVEGARLASQRLGA